MRRERNPRGQVLLMATLMIPVTLGMLALAADLGLAYGRKHAAQAAADAAAAAAVKAAMADSGGLVCGTRVLCATVTCPATLPGTRASNFDDGCLYASLNGASGAAVQLTGNTTSPPPNSPSVSVSYWVTARATTEGPVFFSYLLGARSQKVSARATAAAVSGSGAGDCVIALNNTAPLAFQAGNNAHITSACGVRVNSTAAGADAYPSTDAMWLTGSATVTAPSIQVGGQAQIDASASATPTPTTGASAGADPLINRTIPDYSSLPCTSGNFTSNSWQTGGVLSISPARFCDGLTFANNSTATFQPGRYFIEGGNMTLGSGMTFSGTGVTFFLLGSTTPASLQIGNGVTVNLAAPSSGTYQGLLFFQQHGTPPNKTPSAVNWLQGGANTTLVGTLYFRDSAVRIDNGTSTSGAFALIADTMSFQGGATLKLGGTAAQTGLSSPPVFAMIE